MTTKNLFFTVWRQCFNRRRIIRNLEIVQDFIVISLSFFLLVDMVLILINVAQAVLTLETPEFQDFTSDVLFLLILVELFRLLIHYLQEHRISVEVAVEVSIVSVLREIIVHGALEIGWHQIAATSGFLLVLGLLLLVCHQEPRIQKLRKKASGLILKDSQ